MDIKVLRGRYDKLSLNDKIKFIREARNDIISQCLEYGIELDVKMFEEPAHILTEREEGKD
jgi:hypothetical protein